MANKKTTTPVAPPFTEEIALFAPTSEETNEAGISVSSLPVVVRPDRPAQSEEILESSFLNTDTNEEEAIFLVKKNTGQIIETTPFAQKLYKFSAEKFKTLTINQLLVPNVPIKETFGSGQKFLTTAFHRKGDGSIFLVNQKTVEIKLKGEQYVIYSISETNSIGERPQTTPFEFDLIDISESIGVGILWVNEAGQIIYFNNLIAQMLNYNEYEFPHNHIGNMVSLFDQSIWRQQWRKIKENDKIKFEALLLTKDSIPLSAEITAILVKKEEVEYVCLSVQDISKQVLSETTLTRKIQLERIIASSALHLSGAENTEMVANKFYEVLDRLHEIIDSERIFWIPQKERVNLPAVYETKRAGKPVQETFADLSQDPDCIWWKVVAARTDFVFSFGFGEKLPEQAQKEMEIFRRDHVDSLLCVPINLKNVVYGSLGIVNQKVESREFIEAEIYLLKVIGSTMFSAYEQAMNSEALAKSQEVYKTLVETSTDAIMLFDYHGKNLLAANNRSAELFGNLLENRNFGQEDFYNQFILKAERSFIEYKKYFTQNNSLVESRCLLRTANNQQFWAEISISIIKSIQENPVSVMIVIRDITERLQYEDQLRKLSMAVEQSSVATIIINLNQKIEYVNQKFNDMTGYSLDEICENNIALNILFPNGSQSIFSKIIPGETSQNEVEITNKHGGRIWVRNLITPVSDQQNQITHYLIISEDISASKSYQKKINSQVERLTAFRAIDNTINSTRDLDQVMNILLEKIHHLLDDYSVRLSRLTLFDQTTHSFNRTYTKGINFIDSQSKIEKDVKRLYLDTILEQKSIFLEDLFLNPHYENLSQFLNNAGIYSFVCIPIVSMGVSKGIIEIYGEKVFTAHDSEFQELIDGFSNQASVAINSTELFAGLQKTHLELATAYDETIEGWSRALDLRDQETEGHTQRTAALTTKMARIMGKTGEELKQITRGALLHDIGKMGVPDHILLKQGALTDEEWVQMKKHPDYAYQLLSPIAFLGSAIDIPYCHHEKWDGSGYPRGLKGEQIPLAARIFAIVDVWDALTSDRPYRKAMTDAQAKAIILAGKGKHFDPKVVEVFLQLID